MLYAGPIGLYALACVRAFMPATIWSALMRLLQVIGLLWAKEVHQASCDHLYAHALEAVCAVELHLPLSERDIKLHEVVMIALSIKNLGESRLPLLHCLLGCRRVHVVLLFDQSMCSHGSNK